MTLLMNHILSLCVKDADVSFVFIMINVARIALTFNVPDHKRSRPQERNTEKQESKSHLLHYRWLVKAAVQDNKDIIIKSSVI